MASSLALFPDEVLANILSHPSASDSVISLWLSGNHALNARLSRGGCTSFVTSVVQLLKWPRLLAELKSLRHIEIRATLVQEPIEWMHQELSKLPSSLTNLHLEFEGATRLISPPTRSFSYSQGSFPLLDLSSMFPDLLSLYVKNGSIKSNRLYSEDAVPLLPKRLISLTLDAQIASECYEMLPRSLTRLDTVRTFKTQTTRQDLPTSLTFCPVLHPLSIEELSYFTSLKILELPPRPALASDISALPSGVTEIRLQFAPDSLFEPSIWPRNLTSMTVGSLSPTNVASLPDSLLNLTASNIRGLADYVSTLPPDADPYGFWPKNLVSLSLYSINDVSWTQEAKWFPRTLTSLLHLGVTTPNDPLGLPGDFDSTIFPPLLKHLDFACLMVVPAAKKDSTKLGLPSSLETLKMHWTAYPGDIIVPQIPTSCLTSLDIASKIPVEHLPLLPRQLTFLDIHGLTGSIAIDSLKHLPSGLKKLHMLFAMRHELPAEAFAYLPRSLKFLKLHQYRALLELYVYLPTTIASVLVGVMEGEFTLDVASRIPLHWLIYLIQDILVISSNLEVLYNLVPEGIRLTPMTTAHLKRFLPARKLRPEHTPPPDQ